MVRLVGSQSRVVEESDAMQWAAWAFPGLEAVCGSQSPGVGGVEGEIVRAWVLPGVAVGGRVGSAVVAVVAAANSVAVVVLLRYARPGCGTEVVAARVVAAWDMVRRQETRVAVCSHEGVVVAEPAVVSRAWRQHVCWIFARWKVQ